MYVTRNNNIMVLHDTHYAVTDDRYTRYWIIQFVGHVYCVGSYNVI